MPINLNASTPIVDEVMRFGGIFGGYTYPIPGTTPPYPPAVDLVESCSPTSSASNSDWQASTPPMPTPRAHGNAVLLPDGSTFVVGGTTDSRNSSSANLLKKAELLLPQGIWRQVPDMAVGRGYHSTAMLLPSGKVLVAGGEGRDKHTGNDDYQIYNPPYLFRGPRPKITTISHGQWAYDPNGTNPTYTIDYTLEGPVGGSDVSIEKVVLMRPGATTHHSDFDQRAVILKQEASPNPGATVAVRAPRHTRDAPKGYYMVFLVSNKGVPSKAGWIRLQ